MKIQLSHEAETAQLAHGINKLVSKALTLKQHPYKLSTECIPPCSLATAIFNPSWLLWLGPLCHWTFAYAVPDTWRPCPTLTFAFPWLTLIQPFNLCLNSIPLGDSPWVLQPAAEPVIYWLPPFAWCFLKMPSWLDPSELCWFHSPSHPQHPTQDLAHISVQTVKNEWLLWEEKNSKFWNKVVRLFGFSCWFIFTS